MFRNDEQGLAAAGYFIHVYVDRRSGRTLPVPVETREALVAITT